MNTSSEKYFASAAEMTADWMEAQFGGPFGATIVRGDEVIVTTGNRQMIDTDPTAHAEIVAIREACKLLGTRDLSDCTIYATCEPCPMCVGAIIWAGIKDCYFAATSEDADLAGFSDLHLRRFLRGEDTSVLNLQHVGNRDDCDALFPAFWEMHPTFPPSRSGA
ncbi:MAG: nucleoside deaminase [Micrococcales bacterium]|nr:nucleoside deaminase [Micrococcales bacterium]